MESPAEPTENPEAALVYEPACRATLDWPDPCTFLASHTPGHKSEIWTATDPRNPDVVVHGAKDLNPESSNQCVWNGVFVSQDGGASWTDVVIGGSYASRGPTSPYFGWACNTDPMLQFHTDGTLYYLVELYNFAGQDASGPTDENRFQTGFGFVLARSDDGGLTWPTATRLATGPGLALVLDYNRMTISPTTGTVLTGWSVFNDVSAYQAEAPYEGVMLVATRERGTRPDAPQVLVPPRTDVPHYGMGDVAAAPDGTFVLMFDPSGYGTPGTVYTARSGDDGATWEEPRYAFYVDKLMGRYVNHTRVRTGTHFELAYAPDGTLYTTYAANETGDTDIYVRWSLDDGTTWSDAVKVNAGQEGHAQWHPNVAVSPDGVVHLIYFDRRYDPGDRLVDVTYAESADGGRTWGERRVTNASFDADLGRHQFGFPFIGDYVGIDASQDVVWLGFPTTATGEAVVAAARLHRAPTA